MVDQERSPDLLADTLRGLAAEHDPRAPLVGFDLGEDRFDLPAFTVEGGQLPGRVAAGVEEAGDKTVAVGGGFELVGKDTDLDRIPAGPGRWRHGCGRARPVAKSLVDGQDAVGGHPPQQIGSGGGERLPQRDTKELTVGQDELARAAGTGQAADQGDFPGAAAGESATPLGTSSTSARPQPPHWPLPPAGASRSASTASTTLWSCGTSTWRTRSLRIHCWTWPRPTTTPYATTWTRRRDDAHVRGDSRGEDRRRTPRRRPSRQRRP